MIKVEINYWRARPLGLLRRKSHITIASICLPILTNHNLQMQRSGGIVSKGKTDLNSYKLSSVFTDQQFNKHLTKKDVVDRITNIFIDKQRTCTSYNFGLSSIGPEDKTESIVGEKFLSAVRLCTDTVEVEEGLIESLIESSVLKFH
jgi:hypothetical protein